MVSDKDDKQAVTLFWIFLAVAALLIANRGMNIWDGS